MTCLGKEKEALAELLKLQRKDFEEAEKFYGIKMKKMKDEVEELKWVDEGGDGGGGWMRG